jgi:hypothetical protein
VGINYDIYPWKSIIKRKDYEHVLASMKNLERILLTFYRNAFLSEKRAFIKHQDRVE